MKRLVVLLCLVVALIGCAGGQHDSTRYQDMTHTWTPCGSHYSANGRLVIANANEWVMVAVDSSYVGGGQIGRLIELRSTDQGETWSEYDVTAVIGVGGVSYDAAVDDHGVIHVVYEKFNGDNLCDDLYEITRTAWQTWTTPTLLYSTPFGYGTDTLCLVASPDATELTLVYLPHNNYGNSSTVYGAKWSTTTGWDASATRWSEQRVYATFYSAAAVYAADGTVYVCGHADWTTESGTAVLCWTWGSTTATTLASGDDIDGVCDLIVTGTTVHVLYAVSTAGSAPLSLYFDSQCISGSDELPSHNTAVFAERPDGVQVIYYLSKDATENYFTLKRSQMDGDTPGSVLEYCPSWHLQIQPNFGRGLTRPAREPNTEGILGCLGWYSGSTAMNVLQGTGLPEVPIIHSFPWVGKFQLSFVP